MGAYSLLVPSARMDPVATTTSEMESAALFIVASYLRVRCGACFLAVANQEREKAGLPNPVVHDTEAAIKVGVEAIRVLIKEEREKNQTV